MLRDAAGRGAVPVSEARFLWGDGELYVLFHASDLDLQVRTTERDVAVATDDSVVFSFFLRPDAAAGSPGRAYLVQITPTGVVADGECPADALDAGDARCAPSWDSRARVGASFDGTLNQSDDFDEEWTVEAAFPLAALAGAFDEHQRRLRVAIRRCERAYDGVHSCGAWGGPGGPATLVLDGDVEDSRATSPRSRTDDRGSSARAPPRGRTGAPSDNAP